MTDIFTVEKRSAIMKRVRNRNTNIEILLRKALHKKGFRFKLTNSLFGKPDIILNKYKVVIFCDGDFWHGKNFKKEKVSYKDFWINKIESNIKRDKLVNKTLSNEGWKVIRFWKTDILRNVDGCVDKVLETCLYRS